MAGTSGTTFLLAAAIMALLALLVGPVAANTQVERKLATKHMHRSLQTSVFCPTELAVCSEDASCSVCLDHFAGQYDGCFEEFCDDSQQEFCCALEGEEEDCATDSAFADYIGGYFTHSPNLARVSSGKMCCRLETTVDSTRHKATHLPPGSAFKTSGTPQCTLIPISNGTLFDLP